MATTWLIAKQGQHIGPMSSSELKQLVQTGHLLPTDLIWQVGTASWTQASSVPGLFHQETAVREPEQAMAVDEHKPADEANGLLAASPAPASDGMMRFLCPNCSKRLKAPPGAEGRRVNCNKCGQDLVIPGTPTPNHGKEFTPEPPSLVPPALPARKRTAFSELEQAQSVAVGPAASSRMPVLALGGAAVFTILLCCGVAFIGAFQAQKATKRELVGTGGEAEAQAKRSAKKERQASPSSPERETSRLTEQKGSTTTPKCLSHKGC